MTPKQKLRVDVMISSTSIDLPKHRDAASRAISLLSLNPIGMEKLPASERDAIEASYKLVDEADVYVGIFGFRYGFVPPDTERNPDQKSITELEYRRARERGIPVFCFFMHDEHLGPETAKDGEKFYEQTEAGKKKLETLKKEISSKPIIKEFKNPDELSQRIYHTLNEAIKEGVIKTEEDSPASISDFVLPKPPTPYYAHPLIETSHFIGRAKELDALITWAESASSALVIHAIGGEGKSSLAWEWTKQHHTKFEATIWWSFYEADAGTEAFIRYSLAYLTGKPLEELKLLTDTERTQQLPNILKSKRVLLVLDGFERLLVAYQNMSFTQTLDEHITDSIDNRSFTDPRYKDFFQKLAQCSPSKVIVTSRLIPSALEDKSHALIAGVEQYELRGLHPDDALALLRHHGITGNDQTIKNFTQKFDNHSLILGVIAGRVKYYRAAPNNFDEWVMDEGAALRLEDTDLTQRNTHILQYALNDLSHELNRLLGQCSAFRYYPLSYEQLKGVNPYSKATYKQKASAKLNEGLDMLESRGLIQWNRAENTYNVHPVVRAVILDETVTPRALQIPYFHRIESYFQSLPAEDLEIVTEVHQLKRSIEIYTALVRAGKFDQASDFYDIYLGEIFHHQLAAYHTILELLTPLFHKDMSRPLRLSTLWRKSMLMMNLATAFYHLGQDDKAQALQEAALKLFLDQEDALNLVVVLINYGNTLRGLNQIKRVEAVCSLGLALTEVTEDRDTLAMVHWRFHRFTSECGKWEEADMHYQAFMANPPTTHTDLLTGEIECQKAQVLLAQGLLLETEASLERAWDLALKSRHKLNRRVILALRGELALAHTQPDKAVEYFNEAIGLMRTAGASDVVIALGGLARALLASGKPDEARKIVETHLYSNRQGEAIDAAEVWLGLGERDKARERALAAYKYGWADGPPYINWYMLKRAKKVLDTLGEPYPDLPPFDPSKVEPIPYETEIRAFIEELKREKS